MQVSSRYCPICEGLLTQETLEAVVIDHCRRGCGNFFDKGEAEKTISPVLEPGIWDNATLVKSRSVGRLKSPVTNEPMEHIVLVSDPPLEIDRCQSTGGIWLDTGECARFYEVVLAAGQEKDHQLGKGRTERGAGSYIFQLLSGLPLESWNPTRKRPAGTLWVIAVTILFFGLQTLGPLVNAFFMLTPALVQKGMVWQLLTYGLLHANFSHIFGNLYILYLYGDNVEDIMGKRNFLQLLAYSTIAGGVLHVFLQPNPVVGLSGGVAGVMAAYFVLFPKVKIRFVFFFIKIRVPAILVGMFWFGSQLLGLSSEGSRVAYWVHLGGFFCGAWMAYQHGGLKTVSERIRQISMKKP
jgi:membrane associated rhomboid family serine protease/Zn-finger nucleic acid-binding protein